jgi:ABC-type uncharacterized transport system permease subunit
MKKNEIIILYTLAGLAIGLIGTLSIVLGPNPESMRIAMFGFPATMTVLGLMVGGARSSYQMKKNEIIILSALAGLAIGLVGTLSIVFGPNPESMRIAMFGFPATMTVLGLALGMARASSVDPS